MYADLRKAGVELIAVNAGDHVALVSEYLKTSGFTFPVGMDVFGEGRVSNQFGVMAYPTNYVINKDGVIVDAILGFDEARLKAALRKIGVVFE